MNHYRESIPAVRSSERNIELIKRRPFEMAYESGTRIMYESLVYLLEIRRAGRSMVMMVYDKRKV